MSRATNRKWDDLVFPEHDELDYEEEDEQFLNIEEEYNTEVLDK